METMYLIRTTFEDYNKNNKNVYGFKGPQYIYFGKDLNYIKNFVSEQFLVKYGFSNKNKANKELEKHLLNNKVETEKKVWNVHSEIVELIVDKESIPNVEKYKSIYAEYDKTLLTFNENQSKIANDNSGDTSENQ